jgi:SBF-like CPA transporter family (DUF4137)
MKYRGPKKGNLQNGLILALVCAVGLAFLFPSPGAKGGWMHPDLLNNAGIALIFFLQGSAMPVERMKSGAGNWRLHLIIQSFTFVLFPGGWVSIPRDYPPGLAFRTECGARRFSVSLRVTFDSFHIGSFDRGGPR